MTSKYKIRSDRNRFRLLLNVTVIVAILVTLKLIIYYLEWDIITVNPLFSGVVAANVFLMGFLLNGVLADFKESERLPGEMAVSLENLAQEIRGMGLVNKEMPTINALQSVLDVGEYTLKWFHKKTRTAFLIACINDLTDQLAIIEPYSQATLVSRLKQEQSNLRRMITRAHTIRETSFIESGYLLAYVITFSLGVGLIFSKIASLYESIFYVTIIAYFLVFLLILIRDLDNPFEYYNPLSGEDVSLKPIEDAVERLRTLVAQDSPTLKQDIAS